MWTRKTDQRPDDTEEHRAEEELRSSLRSRQFRESHPGDAYWQNLIVRTNQRVDEASSGKALSVSWAARVAVPGVVAIIFFFVGLHYYVPETTPQPSVADLILSMPEASQDSFVLRTVTEVPGDPGRYEGMFDLSGEEASAYLLDEGSTTLLLELLTEEQTEVLLDRLRSQNEHPSL